MKTEYNITLLVLSGLPNPHWLLNTEQSAEFERLLSTLTESPDAPARFAPGLGYTGISVQFIRPDGTAADARVHNGIVSIGTTTLVDRDRRLERWLIKSGERQAPANLLNIARQELS